MLGASGLRGSAATAPITGNQLAQLDIKGRLLVGYPLVKTLPAQALARVFFRGPGFFEG